MPYYLFVQHYLNTVYFRRHYFVQLRNLARVGIKVSVRVRFRSGICKLRMRNSKIAQRNLQIAQLHKSRAPTLQPLNVSHSPKCSGNWSTVYVERGLSLC